MKYSVDVFWSFRSPYCYFALDRLLEIHRREDATIIIRPVYPMAIRDADFFKRTNPQYRAYHTLDSKRIAEFLGLPFRRPVPDPIVHDPETHEFAREQPYIFRLTRLGAAAQLAGKSAEFVDHMSRLLWDGSTDNWHLGDHVAKALKSAEAWGQVLNCNILTNSTMATSITNVAIQDLTPDSEGSSPGSRYTKTLAISMVPASR